MSEYCENCNYMRHRCDEELRQQWNELAERFYLRTADLERHIKYLTSIIVDKEAVTIHPLFIPLK